MYLHKFIVVSLLMLSRDDVQKFVKFYESELGKKILGAEVEYLRRELWGRRRVLDVGCGVGVFEEMLTEFEIVGVDKSEWAIEEARRRCDKEFVVGEAEHLPFPSATFDAAFAVTVLEFLDDSQTAIREVARVLKPRGKFIAMMLNPRSEYFKLHSRPDSYFRKIKHLPLEIENQISAFFQTSSEYFLGIGKKEIFETEDPNLAALYVVKGIKAV